MNQIERQCAVCKNHFVPKTVNSVFCSKKCSDVAYLKKKDQQKQEEQQRAVVDKITTVEWDKKRTARTDADGTRTYKAKRDDNGIIIYRSEKDRESMLYADEVRKLRQREYDNADLYNDTENAQAEQKERSQQNFVEYLMRQPRNQMDIANFLKIVFPNIFRDATEDSIKSHLKDDELKGVIKIEEKMQ